MSCSMVWGTLVRILQHCASHLLAQRQGRLLYACGPRVLEERLGSHAMIPGTWNGRGVRDYFLSNKIKSRPFCNPPGFETLFERWVACTFHFPIR
jgi:hypothetical protein